MTPDDPVESWGFEGMLAAIDRGYAKDWSKLVAAVAANPGLDEMFNEARDAAESRASVAVIDAALERARRTPEQQKRARVLSAVQGTRMTPEHLSRDIGITPAQLTAYIAGSGPLPEHVVDAVQAIAEDRRAPSIAHNLIVG